MSFKITYSGKEKVLENKTALKDLVEKDDKSIVAARVNNKLRELSYELEEDAAIEFDTKIIVNVCGRSVADYVEVVEKLGDQPIDMMEINVSCPNVKHGGIAFGQNPDALYEITKEIKAKAKQLSNAAEEDMPAPSGTSPA